MFDTNLLDIIRVTKAFIPYFREKKNVYLLQLLQWEDLYDFQYVQYIILQNLF